MDFLRGIVDHRRGQGRRYDLAGVVLVTILAVLSNAHSYRSIHTFMTTHFPRLKKTLGLSWRRAPSYTRIRSILQGMDKATLEEAFRSYSMALSTHTPEGCEVLACDGKALRGSFDHMDDRRAAEILSVFATGSQLILAHREIPDKTNEIPAFQALIGELGLTGNLFTLDAMHCQKKRCKR